MKTLTCGVTPAGCEITKEKGRSGLFTRGEDISHLNKRTRVHWFDKFHFLSNFQFFLFFTPPFNVIILLYLLERHNWFVLEFYNVKITHTCVFFVLFCFYLCVQIGSWAWICGRLASRYPNNFTYVIVHLNFNSTLLFQQGIFPCSYVQVRPTSDHQRYAPVIKFDNNSSFTTAAASCFLPFPFLLVLLVWLRTIVVNFCCFVFGYSHEGISFVLRDNPILTTTLVPFSGVCRTRIRWFRKPPLSCENGASYGTNLLW